MENQVQDAVRHINAARRTVAFTGAGISTEAGIPDFRSKGGLWENEALLAQLSAPGFRSNPAGFYRASLKLMPTINHASPTSSHRLLAGLESAGKLSAVVTQNIDGLHQAAGSRKVYEIHGSYQTGSCTRCPAVYDMRDFYTRISQGELDVPTCNECSAPIKPDVVLFGDILPREVWQAAVEEVGRCDLMIVLGSSLVVYPAAGLPQMAIRNGARLIIVNREPTEFDQLASLVIHDQLGVFADAVMERLGDSFK